VLGAGEWFTHTFAEAEHVVFSVANHTGDVIVLPNGPPTPSSTPTQTSTSTPTTPTIHTPTPTSTLAPAFAIVAAGDIARCSGIAGAHGTANLIKGMPEARVLALGDLAYSSGTDAEFQNCYGPTWGQFKDRTHPSPGNHEYRTAGAAGYYRYFGVPEYYAWDFGDWHFVSFNTEIDYAVNSAQMNWLRADLAASPAQCKLVYWHRPRFSSGASHGSTSSLSSVWAVLQSYSVTLVLAGHEHTYERFGPQDASGRALPNGIREFVVGTGGTGFYRFNATPEPNSEFRLTNAYGVLKLDLLPSSYSWQFIAVDGTVKDSGTASCN
jgi:3',5'-cyclic AMP phosphodiesterase CpdA